MSRWLASLSDGQLFAFYGAAWLVLASLLGVLVGYVFRRLEEPPPYQQDDWEEQLDVEGKDQEEA